jgi:pimeloyl-ACP methyl ester carboxylesterase
VELQGRGHTADTGRAMTIEALAGDVIALLDHLGIAQADLFGFSLGGLVAYAVALGARTGRQADRRVGGRPPPAGRIACVDHDVPQRVLSDGHVRTMRGPESITQRHPAQGRPRP